MYKTTHMKTGYEGHPSEVIGFDVYFEYRGQHIQTCFKAANEETVDLHIPLHEIPIIIGRMVLEIFSHEDSQYFGEIGKTKLKSDVIEAIEKAYMDRIKKDGLSDNIENLTNIDEVFTNHKHDENSKQSGLLSEDGIIAELIEVARSGNCCSYKAFEENYWPCKNLGELFDDLTATMERDYSEGRPFLASLVVNGKTGVPGKGFFIKANKLGCYEGVIDGEKAKEYALQEARRVVKFWGGEPII